MAITRLAGVCALAGALVLVTGCGHSSPSASSPRSDTSSVVSSPAPSPSPTVTPATVAQLRAIMLKPTDLPGGWKASPAEPDTTRQADDAELAKCKGIKNTDEDQVATVDSDDFDLGDASISSSASSYKSQSDLDLDIAALTGPRYTPCHAQLISKRLAELLPKGSRLGTVSIKVIPEPGGSWPANVVGIGTATVPMTVNGQQTTFYDEFAAITGPLIEAEVQATNLGAPVPAAALLAAVQAVTSRTARG